jgi:hypothetical protein
MKTEVEMKRELFGGEIRQRSKSEFFSATDLVRAANKHRKRDFNLSQWLNRETTKEFVVELKRKYGDVCFKGRGRNAVTWIHPYLFIDLALSIDPKLKIRVYDWLYDLLLKYRNDSGDSYKKMTGSIFRNIDKKINTKKEITEVARKIKNAIGVEDWNSTTEEKLKLRDKIHENISLLADYLPIDQAVENGISKALEEGN